MVVLVFEAFRELVDGMNFIILKVFFFIQGIQCIYGLHGTNANKGIDSFIELVVFIIILVFMVTMVISVPILIW